MNKTGQGDVSVMKALKHLPFRHEDLSSLPGMHIL